MYRQMHRKASAFTLIELLVSVAIIAVLMAILIPSIAGAKRSAQTSVCLSNMRQLGIGTTMYQQENNGCFPYPVGDCPLANGNSTAEDRMCWYSALDGYLGPLARDNSTGTTSVKLRNFRKFKQCPVWDSISRQPYDPAYPTGMTIQQYSKTIKMNTHLRQGNPNTSLYQLARIGDIERPGDHVAFADGGATDMIPWGTSATGGNQNETSQFSLDTTDRTLGGLGLRHSGAANVGFVDGHAATVKLKTYTRVISGNIKIENWKSEWLDSGGAEVTGTYKLRDSVEQSGYRRNPDMPLVWSIPGKLYR